ncbi:MAG: type II toxin-antitoxin system PemK/MazF family toxin [Actinomycetia bacterium]|nr:type II toxin-antitoxin system PemK/MazF family toxin [Actinomycetes bacterium]
MASTEPLKPRPGDVWLTACGGARVGEPGKTRPAVVLSAQDPLHDSVYDLVIVAPISAGMPPAAVRPPVAATPDTGLAVDSVIVVRAIRGMSRTRLVRRLGAVDAATLTNVQEILAALLDLP